MNTAVKPRRIKFIEEVPRLVKSNSIVSIFGSPIISPIRKIAIPMSRASGILVFYEEDKIKGRGCANLLYIRNVKSKTAIPRMATTYFR